MRDAFLISIFLKKYVEPLIFHIEKNCWLAAVQAERLWKNLEIQPHHLLSVCFSLYTAKCIWKVPVNRIQSIYKPPLKINWFEVLIPCSVQALEQIHFSCEPGSACNQFSRSSKNIKAAFKRSPEDATYLSQIALIAERCWGMDMKLDTAQKAWGGEGVTEASFILAWLF